MGLGFLQLPTGRRSTKNPIMSLAVKVKKERKICLYCCMYVKWDQYPSIMWETFEKLGSQLQERKEKPDFELIVADGLELRPRLSRLSMMYYDVYDVEPHVFLPSERNRMSMMQHEEAGTPLLAFFETWKGGCLMMMMIWSKPRLGVGRWSRCVGPSLCRSTHGQATVNPQPS